MVNEELKNEIEAIVTEYHEANKGLRSIRVGALQRVLTDRFDRVLSWNEVKIACDELVDEGRVIFLFDSAKSGRRYASPAADEQTIRYRKAVRGPSPDLTRD